jgi:hypothetical protein
LFITGTAATLINIEGFSHQGNYFDVMKSGNQDVSNMLREKMNGLRHGLLPDTFGWIEVL